MARLTYMRRINPKTIIPDKRYAKVILVIPEQFWKGPLSEKGSLKPDL